MEGVQFIVDSEGKKTSVVINLKKHGRLWQDIYDNWLAEKRRHEPRETLQFVRNRLQSQGKRNGRSRIFYLPEERQHAQPVA